jgi:hypothetical protein
MDRPLLSFPFSPDLSILLLQSRKMIAIGKKTDPSSFHDEPTMSTLSMELCHLIFSFLDML